MNNKRPVSVSLLLSLSLGPGVGLGLAACGGSSVPAHSGYPLDKGKEPWASAKRVSLDDNFEGKADGSVSFPRRERARWFLIKLPIEGALEAKLTLEPVTKGADVGFEILDAGFNIVAKDNEEEQGQLKKERKVVNVARGDTYLHVFTLGRPDEADFKIRVRFVPSGQPDNPTAFPGNVPNAPELAAVPTKDDTPTRTKPRAETKPEPKPQTAPKPTDEKGTVIATISQFGEAGNGLIHITINKGTAANVDRDWEGYVIQTASGKKLPGSDFVIKKADSTESDAFVKASMDDIQRNRRVAIKPPKTN
jgi:hypothetical protein